MIRAPHSHGDRGVSFTVSYVLTIAIAVVLVAGVMVTVGQVVKNEQRTTIRGEAAVVGDQTAAAMMAADRLVRKGDNSSIALAVELPRQLADTPYTVSLRSPGGTRDAIVIVETQSPSITVRTPFVNHTAVENTTVTGGAVRVVTTDGRLTLAGGAP